MNKHFLLLKKFWVVQNNKDKISYYFTSSLGKQKKDVKITNNGIVDNATWEYIDYGKSIIINVKNEQTLYHIDKISHNEIILIKDGTNDIIHFKKEN